MATPSGSYSLDRIQLWMQSVIMHPGGVVAGIGSESAQRQIEITGACAEQVIRRSRRQSSIDRLQVYANAYYARLLGCLREEFPATVHALGEEAFDALAFGYLQAHPSHSYTLANLGRHFPKYLADTRPKDAGRDEGIPSWPDFLIDLTTVERTYSEVFDGPGIENRQTLSVDDLMKIPQERWPQARLLPVPCLRLLSLQYPVHEYISAVRYKTETVIPEPNSTYLVITRREFVVRRRPISRGEFFLLKSLVEGLTVGAALERIADSADVDRLSADLHEWFRSWAAARYFLAVEYPR